jgi:AcrR family transcriptional regulator
MEILNAGARLIVERGYEAFTMRAVASLVNVKAGSIYYHFASKDEIVEEILNTGIARLLDYVQRVLGELPSEAPLETRLKAAVMAHVSCMVGLHRDLMQIYEHLPPVMKRRSRKMREKYALIWYDMLADGSRRGELDNAVELHLLVPFFLGALNRIPEWLRTAGATAEDIAALATRVLLQGVRSSAPPVSSLLPVLARADNQRAGSPAQVPDLVAWAGDS